MISLDPDRWLHCTRPVDDPAVRLFCFPYAGGSATIYRDWSDLLPPAIEVQAVQLPGRPGRMSEPPIDDVPTVVDALFEVMESRTDRPYAFYGHSMGSLLAYELARKLWDVHRHGPDHLFVASRRAPHLPSRNATLHEQPAERVREFLKTLHVVPTEVLDNEELMQLLLPTLRADLKLDVNYEYTAGPGVACPIHAFSGVDDHYVLKSEISAWSMHAGSVFELRYLPGDHFFVDNPQRRTPLLKSIASELAHFAN